MALFIICFQLNIPEPRNAILDKFRQRECLDSRHAVCFSPTSCRNFSLPFLKMMNSNHLNCWFSIDGFSVIWFPLLRPLGTQYHDSNWRIPLHRRLRPLVAGRDAIHCSIDGQLRYQHEQPIYHQVHGQRNSLLRPVGKCGTARQTQQRQLFIPSIEILLRAYTELII